MYYPEAGDIVVGVQDISNSISPGSVYKVVKARGACSSPMKCKGVCYGYVTLALLHTDSEATQEEYKATPESEMCYLENRKPKVRQATDEEAAPFVPPRPINIHEAI